ncbi:DUF4097 family beta strand repeat-containing protein [Nonomuraea glycinis]|uniref:DUF4097 family beta strand repeat-containing protein n=1 Tax=Nonomuraea glycinis TaxID=2047744 RepID=UPI002E1611AD|nr:DUF4097 domain-containing protein [Nonomuraea glycinis]
MRRNVALAAATAGLVGTMGLTGCTLNAEQVHSARAFPHTGGTLTITSTLGGLRILPGTGGEVRVDRWLRGKAAGDGHSSWTLENGTLRLDANCQMIVGDCGGRYHIRVPPGIRLVIDAGDDGVILDKITHDADVSAEGAIRLYETTGKLRLAGGDGMVAGNGLRSTDVKALTRSGTINLTFAVPPARLDARSSEGQVTVNVPKDEYAITVKSKEGRARSELKNTKSSRTIVARSTSGDVRITANPS